ncbi:MAG TPA: 50S ribosomal protein L29 [Caldisericia bacterium]|jgi:large subunit ribosomal protein L29|nr:50S ribosomal protein L29 [bacterium]NMD14378.1 50S ribosomal protein L29 [Caldisericales bacterium]OQB74360.1 MAG: 50S ribosomal protein L29 [bacterium ADurb.Bin132]HNY61222.1 50S ribosomal protein L29 [Caldisericia bacterium]HOC78845.1 50S ribosomal protein L29 [Caldisericia bacterium]
MKLYKIKEMSTVEMEKKVEELEKELALLVFRHKNRQLDKVMKLREVKRDIARLKTFIHQAKEE